MTEEAMDELLVRHKKALAKRGLRSCNVRVSDRRSLKAHPWIYR
jgi:hypothetical protein